VTEHEYKRLSAPADLAATRAGLSPERRHAADAMKLYLRLAHALRFAVAERDQHAYRRTFRVFRRAARRLERRHAAITPQPKLQLGNIHNAPAMPTRAAKRTLAAAA